MLDRGPEVGMTFGDQLDLLASEIHQMPGVKPHDIIEHACTRLARIEPISNAGIFRWSSSDRSLEWMYHSHPDAVSFSKTLQTHLSGLSEVLRDGISSQFAPSNRNETNADTFVGIPIGEFNGNPAGLGVSSNRSLEQAEMHRLTPFALILGLIAENARLKHQIEQEQEQDSGSTARLIGFIAHELRTPLTGMRGNIQLALMASQKEQYDRIPKRLQTAISSVDEMTGMVQKLLDVSRLERGSYPFDSSSSDISQTILAAVESAATDDRLATLQIRAETIDELVIDHDRSAFQQMLCYLLLAVNQYSSDSGDITLSATDESDTFRIQITYAGKMFSTIDQITLVEPLVQAEAARTQHENISLELAFCRGIVTHFGGQIDIASSPYASGEHQITVTLPH
jgi:signal transduction histidine kinase